MARDGVFSNRGFRRLWLANSVGGLGQQFSILALSVTIVQVLHATPAQVGLVAALSTVANLVLGIPIGVWVDALPAKWVLVVAAAVRGLAVLAIPVAFLTGTLTIVQCMIVAALAGTATVFFDTAHTTILPSLVTPQRVSEASARLQTVDTAVAVIGPGLAGQMLRVVTGPILYLVSGIGQLAAAGLVATMSVTRSPDTAVRTREPFWTALRSGLAYVIRHPVLRVFVATNAAINLGAGVLQAVLAIYVLRQLGLSAGVYGLVLSIGALGGILGSLIAMPLVSRFGDMRTRTVTLYALPFAIALIPLAAVLPFPPTVTLCISDLLISGIIVTTSIPAVGIRAKVTPLAMMGRVSAASRTVSLGVLPIGALLGGAVGTLANAEVALWTAVVLAALGALAMFGSPLRGMRTLSPEWDLTRPPASGAEHNEHAQQA
ncbi:MAG: MFS transporter [Lacisediminihabitans sp.]